VQREPRCRTLGGRAAILEVARPGDQMTASIVVHSFTILGTPPVLTTVNAAQTRTDLVQGDGMLPKTAPYCDRGTEAPNATVVVRAIRRIDE